MAFLQPDAYFSRVSRIDVARDLVGRGIATVLLDIDNTIRSRPDRIVPPDVRAWLAHCRAADVGVCLLSNNWHQDVNELAAELELPLVAKAMKPLPGGYLQAMRLMRARVRETAMVGDQLFTDIAGAKALGMRAYLVAPLSEVDLPHMAALRRVERLLLGDPADAPVPAPAAARPDSAVCDGRARFTGNRTL